jgi:hypothetical protein
MGKLIALVAVGAAAVGFLMKTQEPEIRRYMKISSM